MQEAGSSTSLRSAQNDRARVGHPEFQVGERSATGERKRYRRLRKKIVVPVVQAGKVEIRVKSFAGKELRGGRDF